MIMLLYVERWLKSDVQLQDCAVKKRTKGSVWLNIRPFVDAGVLCSKFNVKWGVNRGKTPPGSFWGAVRDNNKRLSLEEKRAAREKNKK
jgi:hypothetical protein